MSRHRWLQVSNAVIIVLLASPASAQSDQQLWGEITLSWIKSHALTLAVDIEPKVLVSKPEDDPGWATLDVTPSAEFTRSKWFDVVGELHLGRTRQTDAQNSTEVTPRIGFRFHVLSNVVDDLVKERQPRHRIVLRNLARVEWRNLYYSDDTPQSSTVRFRDRIETLYPLNRRRVTDSGAIYATADAEWFWTGQDPSERFASKERIRGGIGYRRNYAWRLEVLYLWDRSRDSAQGGFTTADSGLDIRLWHVW
jgi:hypothetical protein